MPQGPGGQPVGYVDGDVYEASRAFTGWTYARDWTPDNAPAGTLAGEFYTREDWHDRFQKKILGEQFNPDRPALEDGNRVLDLLASHPGTGRHIARKLAQRLLADDPPQGPVDAAAQVFTASWQAPDQIRQTVEALLLYQEPGSGEMPFLTTWGGKVKRPFEIAVSALRATNANVSFEYDDPETNWFRYRYDDAGQELFHWRAPDGFPDRRAAWQSTTPRIMTWRLCGSIVDWDDGNDVYLVDIPGQTPAWARTANELADFWIIRILGRPMPAGERQQVVELMAAGYNPDYDLPVDTDPDTAERLRTMVGLILMSPSFLWR